MSKRPKMSAAEKLARYNAAQERPRERRELAGLCLSCGQPSRPKRRHCLACAMKARERYVKKHGWRGGKYRNSCCGLCHKPGHYRQLCPTGPLQIEMFQETS